MQLLTRVYFLVLSEDNRGYKLDLEASSTVRKSHYSGQKSQYVSGNPGGTWKLKNHLHCTAMWSKWSHALVAGWGGLICWSCLGWVIKSLGLKEHMLSHFEVVWYQWIHVPYIPISAASAAHYLHICESLSKADFSDHSMLDVFGKTKTRSQ